jgi:hypothetical protein
VFLVGVAGYAAQVSALEAALDDIDLDGNLTNIEILVEPTRNGFRVRRFDLP